MKNASRIKTAARCILMGRHASMALYVLIAYLIGSLSSSLPALLFGNVESAPLLVVEYIVTFLVNILVSMIWVGMSVNALKILREEEPSLGNLFYAFRNQPDHFLVLELILSLIRTAIQIPTYVAAYFYAAGQINVLQYLLFTLFWSLAVEVIYMIITLPLSLAVFLMIDDPQLSAARALRMSVRSMKGKNSSLLCLYVSFVGMLLLGVASFMIGFLFVYPYFLTAQAIFYKEAVWGRQY